MASESPRVKATKERLLKALCELLGERSLTEISVSALCEQAGVGRSTFYRHYQLPQDVLTEYFGRIFDENVSLAAQPGEAEIYRVLYAFCISYRDHRELFSSTDLDELSGLVGAALPIEDLDAVDTDGRFTFIAGGVVSTIYRWAASGFAASAESIARSMATFTARILA